MDILQTIGMFLLAAFAVANVALVLYDKRREYGFIWQVWKRFRWKMFFQAFGVVLLTIATGLALAQVPGLNYGWLHLFFAGGGNVLIKPLTIGTDSSYEVVRWLPVLFLTGFLLAIPFLAKMEEEQFRKGHTKWGRIILQSVKFGPIHCLAGIPLAFGIALIVSGLFYGYHYKRSFESNVRRLGREAAEEEAVMVSTTYHSMYNTIVLSVLIGGVIYLAL